MRVSGKELQALEVIRCKSRPNAVAGFNGFSRSKRRELCRDRNTYHRQGKRRLARIIEKEIELELYNV